MESYKKVINCCKFIKFGNKKDFFEIFNGDVKEAFVFFISLKNNFQRIEDIMSYNKVSSKNLGSEKLIDLEKEDITLLEECLVANFEDLQELNMNIRAFHNIIYCDLL